MSSTCLLCYQENEFFVLPPCNHKEICWKCCLKLVEGSIFSCPFCKNKPQIKSQLLFVTKEEMNSQDHATIMKSNPFRSNKNTFYFYSCEQVAEFIQEQTSFYCTICLQVHQTMNQLKKHIYQYHKMQYCDVCLDNRKCLTNEQKLFSEGQLLVHLKQGDISQTGEIVLYHPNCDFCNRRFYDIDAFKLHLKMSTHMKCQICDINSSKLKHVYYKNYDDLERHHKKTHFVCDIGQCIGRKLENVFAAESLLEEHKKRCHRKYKGDKNEKVQNIIFGFNKPQDDLIVFDGIGKNLQKQFSVFERHDKVDKEDHLDNFIDIRQFYLQMVKQYNLWRTEDIINKTIQLSEHYGYKCQEAKLVDIPIFKPLEMPSLTRLQCQRIIKRCFHYREADAIIDLYFTKRNQFTSPNQFFSQIQKKMRGTSMFAFYMIFPQLIRFMKDENKTKVPMDEYYTLKLRLLNVTKKFTFHSYDKYSKLLQFLKSQVQIELIERLQKGSINIDKYCKYLKDMNVNYYIENQEEFFFISKEKVINLYHMIERCKTKDFMKMNWLLKIGFPQKSYQNLISKFFYKTSQQIKGQAFKSFMVKELAIIHLYANICLDALNNPFNFENLKKNARSYYFTEFLDTIKRPSTIPIKVYEQIRTLEGHSNAMQKKIKVNPIKVFRYDEEQCPSLLSNKIESITPIHVPKTEPILQLGIGKTRLPIWNEQSLIKKKVPMVKKIQAEQFPTLAVPQQSKKAKNAKQGNKVDEQQFPVFNFQQKFVHSKKTEKPFELSSLLSFNNKSIVSNKWNQEKTKQKFEQINKVQKQQKLQKKEKQQKLQRQEKLEKLEKLEKIEKIEKIEKHQKHQKEYKPQQQQQKSQRQQKQRPTDKKKEQKFFPQYPKTSKEEDQYIQRAIQQSLLSSKQPKKQRDEPQQQKEQQFTIYKSKKDNKFSQQVITKKVKNKNKINSSMKVQSTQIRQIKAIKEVKEVKEQSKHSQFLFEQIEKEAQLSKVPIPKKTNFLLDWSDGEHEKQKIQLQIKKKQQIKKQNQNIYFDDDDFVSLTDKSSQQKQSIINKIQKQTMMPEEKKVNKVVKTKKGKKVVIERVSMF